MASPKNKEDQRKRCTRAVLERTGHIKLSESEKKRKHNMPSNAARNTTMDDYKRLGLELLRWFNLPAVKDDDEIEERTVLFLQECMEAGQILTVEKYAMALGITRKTFNEWQQGRVGSNPWRSTYLQKVVDFIAAQDGQLVMEGKIRDVAYIFRAKNFYGMQDKVEHSVTTPNMLGERVDKAQLEREIIESVAEDVED